MYVTSRLDKYQLQFSLFANYEQQDNYYCSISSACVNSFIKDTKTESLEFIGNKINLIESWLGN